jgi:hypothetical protein
MSSPAMPDGGCNVRRSPSLSAKRKATIGWGDLPYCSVLVTEMRDVQGRQWLKLAPGTRIGKYTVTAEEGWCANNLTSTGWSWRQIDCNAAIAPTLGMEVLVCESASTLFMRDGTHPTVGWSQDKEKELGKTGTVVSVNGDSATCTIQIPSSPRKDFKFPLDALIQLCAT